MATITWVACSSADHLTCTVLRSLKQGRTPVTFRAQTSRRKDIVQHFTPYLAAFSPSIFDKVIHHFVPALQTFATSLYLHVCLSCPVKQSFQATTFKRADLKIVEITVFISAPGSISVEVFLRIFFIFLFESLGGQEQKLWACNSWNHFAHRSLNAESRC